MNEIKALLNAGNFKRVQENIAELINQGSFLLGYDYCKCFSKTLVVEIKEQGNKITRANEKDLKEILEFELLMLNAYKYRNDLDYIRILYYLIKDNILNFDLFVSYLKEMDLALKLFDYFKYDDKDDWLEKNLPLRIRQAIDNKGGIKNLSIEEHEVLKNFICNYNLIKDSVHLKHLFSC